MRCFVAVDLEKDLVKHIKELQNEIRNLNVDVKFVETENLHFTLKFLGELNENEIDVIKTSIGNGLKGVGVFKIRMRGIGYFGGPNHIRTLWVDVNEGKDKFTELVKNVNECLRIGEKNKTVHLTIGRIKSGKNRELLLNFMDKSKDIKIGEMDVKHVKLKSSVLTRDGPVYSDLAIFELKG
ncbi:MAG: RNA 2',3'-cyclic phosphodiesterase [Candidatus Aenigmarchaeota archaeon]|nr:RNA 2',3'-cyclic phosphodiesterase [Candidatus Aenigmarchaeota archaeon]NIP39935.1 RNA 2',3'-cyclic phosphodiesterase [Candidatus Aenigmarchaeota archaeon]NIQ17654.1 RNA 2',3'-cyclic phosphodiesterase [Candidatus Aenigmarchaeota archaeon]NIS72842.1 RNA 2',3'-cyclic phosphodiesterase [Candidatus Aenigmarchaeota archaeon]